MAPDGCVASGTAYVAAGLTAGLILTHGFSGLPSQVFVPRVAETGLSGLGFRARQKFVLMRVNQCPKNTAS